MKTIAIIEDDEHVGSMMEEALRREGYGVIRAWSGTEPVYLLEKYDPDLVLLDLMLPGMTGEELLPAIKGVPVIVVSAKVGVDDKVEALLGGAADYITKPFEIRELLARIAVRLRGEPEKTSLSAGDLELNTLSRQVTVCGTPSAPDKDRVCHPQDSDAKPDAGHLPLCDPRPDQPGHAGLRRKLPEGACQQSAQKTARGRRQGLYRGRIGDRLSPECLKRQIS